MGAIYKFDKKFNQIKSVSVTPTVRGIAHIYGGRYFVVSYTTSVTDKSIEFVYIDWNAGTVSRIRLIASFANMFTITYGIAFNRKDIYNVRETTTLPQTRRNDKRDRGGALIRSVTISEILRGIAMRHWKGIINAIGNYVIFVDKDGNLIKSWATPSTDHQGIDYDRKHLWLGSANTNRIYQLDLKGNVIKQSAVQGFTVKDIAVDPHFVYATA